MYCLYFFNYLDRHNYNVHYNIYYSQTKLVTYWVLTNLENVIWYHQLKSWCPDLVTRKWQCKFCFRVGFSSNVVSSTALSKFTSSKKCVVAIRGEVCCREFCPLFFHCVPHLLTNIFSPTLTDTTHVLQWHQLAWEATWHAIGPEVRGKSHPFQLDRRWQCRQNRKLMSAELKGSDVLYVIARIHIQYALTSSWGEELLWVRGLQTATATEMTWKEKHSIQHGHGSALIACSQWETQNYCSSIWVLISAPEACRGDAQELARDFDDLRTAAWHHPGTMDTVLGTLPTWCRSCKVGVKCWLHLGLQRF